jgi:predicted HTH domain antitoxin
MRITLSVPDEVASELGGSDMTMVAARLEAELAAAYYEARLVSLGCAAELSGLNRGDFEAMLAQRRTVRDYELADLDADMTRFSLDQ